ncbi:hypothetical protein G6F65_017245 [Rhizopus arrhizus]|nr:hypothetical protein G6F65_017245 [Rhizopus arrhizus]
MHEHAAVAHFARKAHFVRNHQPSHAIGRQLAHHRQHFVDEFGVQRRCDFVAQQRQRLHGQRAGDRHALLLAAGQLFRPRVELVRQAHAGQHGARQVGRLRFRHALGHHGREHHVAPHRQVREQVELLEDHAHLQPQRAQPQFVVAQLGVGHHDGAAVDLLQPIHAAQQRALARAALADDGDDLAGFDA